MSMYSKERIAECAAEVVAADDWRIKFSLDVIDSQPRYGPVALAQSFLAGIAWQKQRQTGVGEGSINIVRNDVSEGDLK